MEYGYQQEIYCPECNNTYMVYGSIKDPDVKVMRCTHCRKWFGYVVNMVTVIEIYRMIKEGN